MLPSKMPYLSQNLKQYCVILEGEANPRMHRDKASEKTSKMADKARELHVRNIFPANRKRSQKVLARFSQRYDQTFLQ